MKILILFVGTIISCSTQVNHKPNHNTAKKTRQTKCEYSCCEALIGCENYDFEPEPDTCGFVDKKRYEILKKNEFYSCKKKCGKNN